jgi:murein DD-endopeptidase MepM/ murein hydrolase activator NlpD
MKHSFHVMRIGLEEQEMIRPKNNQGHPWARQKSEALRALYISLLLALLFSVATLVSRTEASQTGGTDAGIRGTWRGTLGSGTAQLHIELLIARLNNGEYSGQLNSVDQGAVIPMDSLSVEGGKVRFEIKVIGGVYEGTLNDTRTEMKGTWTQTNVPAQPLLFTREASGTEQAPAAAAAPQTGFVGAWDSVTKPGEKQAYALSITKLSNGDYLGQVTMMAEGIPHSFDVVIIDGDSIHAELKAYNGSYDGKLSKDGKMIEGKWTEANSPPEAVSFVRSNKAAAASGQLAGPTTKPFVVPLDIVVPQPPHAFQADGKTHLVYELHVVNMGRWDCLITKLEALTADSAARSLESAAGARLEGMLARPGVTVPEKARIGGGTEAVVYLWLTVDRPSDAPTSVRHRFTVKIGDYPEELTMDTVPLAVSKATPAITSPLRGDHWLAGNGPSNTSGHRRALVPIDGRAAIAQRFAIDWVKLGNEGQTFHGDKLDNKNYFAYGVDALAVADGVVTEVKDGIPENIPGENSRAVPITLETVGGNHVIVDIGGGNFAFYAHLQPGSLRVKLGDKVRPGQVIGLVGNSGNSTEPHLHFHISNGSSPLGSEGLPYVLSSFDVEGSGWSWKPSNGDKPVKHTNEIPLENQVVRFAAQP